MSPICEALVERILSRLGFGTRPEPTLEALRPLYAAWCRAVPFDNLRKLIHVRSGSDAPLPGSTPGDFFENWLTHGTGGTCWSGAGAFTALLLTLGFPVRRGVATMIAAPNIPPNHGTVIVHFDGQPWLVDTSILHHEPLPLREEATTIAHPAWGVRCERNDGRWHITWPALHKPDGFVCRIETIGAEQAEFAERYETTRGWSPFNYEIYARTNHADSVTGLAFGKAVTILADGSAQQAPATREDRVRILIEKIGISEELASQLPQDMPTPPPPGSRTAQAAESRFIVITLRVMRCEDGSGACSQGRSICAAGCDERYRRNATPASQGV